MGGTVAKGMGRERTGGGDGKGGMGGRDGWNVGEWRGRGKAGYLGSGATEGIASRGQGTKGSQLPECRPKPSVRVN